MAHELNELRRRAQRHPECLYTLRALGTLCLSGGHYREAVPAFSRCLLRMGPNHPERATAWLCLARAQLGLGRNDDGLSAVRRALVAGQNDADWLDAAAELVERMGNSSLAKRMRSRVRHLRRRSRSASTS